MSEERNVAIERRIAEGIPPIQADLVRIRQILFNLLSNAIKFSDPGSTVTIVAETVPGTASPLEGPSIRIDVVDRGIGIAAEHHLLIFEEFRQVEVSSDPLRQGTGLGLPLVRRFLALQGGTIEVDSAPGKGSTFRVFLPISTAQPFSAGEPDAVLAAGETSPVETEASLGRKTILVVEDDPTAFRQLAAVLEASGYRVRSAPSGEEALARLARETPALVLLDLLLPGLDGWTLLREIKASETTRHIPVVILTKVADQAACLALGADDFLLKPIDRDTLLAHIETLLTETEPERRGGKLLIVDDDPHAHELLADTLADAGYEAVSATSGTEGIARARSERPDLVVLDLVMPDLSGFEVAASLRADPATASIPIVVLTAADPGPSDRERLAPSIAALLAKGPDSANRLVDTIRAVLERPSAE